MLAYRVNRFWSEVCGHHATLRLEAIDAKSLNDAVRAAFSSTDLTYAFRRNRELIDIGGRFRHFSFRGKAYVAKRLRRDRAELERRNAWEARKRLKGRVAAEFEVEVVTPRSVSLDGDTFALLTPYFGYSLHESLEEISAFLPVTRLVELIRVFLTVGIEWRGLVPRNLLPARSGGKLFLIDWEDATFFDPGSTACVDSLTRMVWLLNWSQVYGREVDLEGALSDVAAIRDSVSPYDEFEATYATLVDSELAGGELRSVCAEATLRSEGNIGSGANGRLTPMEIGHLVDDLFPSSVSVLFTFATSRLRQTTDSSTYAEIFECFAHAFRLAMPRAGALDSIHLDVNTIERLVLLVFFAVAPPARRFDAQGFLKIAAFQDLLAFLERECPMCDALLEYQSLQDSSGWAVARRRSDLLDTILERILACIRCSLPLDTSLELLVRGSLGQGVVSRYSDVDFELSSPRLTHGQRGVESLIIAVLSIFGIRAEGSDGRPEEADLMASAGITRDLHEWSELRRLPGDGRHDPGWLIEHLSTAADGWWERQSIFERGERSLNGKSLFFEARVLVARLAFRHGLSEARTPLQLDALASILPKYEWQELVLVVTNALAAYEKHDSSLSTLEDLGSRIDSLRRAYRLPDVSAIADGGL